MKSLFAVTLLALSMTASAFEFETGRYELPSRVLDLVHAKVESVCFSDVHYIHSLKLISHKMETVRIDQGYKENQYQLVFRAMFKYVERADEIVSITVIDQLEDRSGQLQTYDLNFETNICQ
jgi:hypothetical protein